MHVPGACEHWDSCISELGRLCKIPTISEGSPMSDKGPRLSERLLNSGLIGLDSVLGIDWR